MCYRGCLGFSSIPGLYWEKTMAPHFSILAWKIPWMEEPGRLQSMGSLRVGHHWMTSLSVFAFMHWRRKWQPTPVLLPGEPQGRGGLVGSRLWGHRVGHNWSDLAAAAAGLYLLYVTALPHLHKLWWPNIPNVPWGGKTTLIENYWVTVIPTQLRIGN